MNKNRILFSEKAVALFRLFGVCLFLIFGSARGWAQDYYLSSQEDVNAFPQDITAITGSLVISGESISDLTPLRNLKSIGWILGIYNTALKDLNNLSSLTSLSGLQITNNTALTNVDGLSSLTSDSLEYLIIMNNPALSNLDGFSGLKSVWSEVVIAGNAALTNLDGLSSLTFVVSMTIAANTSLTDCCGIQDLINTPGAVAYGSRISGNKTGCDNVYDINASCGDSDSDGIADITDNCPAVANPTQEDADCDGLGNVCDVCPGGDDSVDNDGDGRPDCKYPPTLDKVLPAWKCGSKKVYICHKSGNNTKTLCISYVDLSIHLAHGDYLGPCGNASCDAPFSGSEQSSEQSITEDLLLYADPELSQAWLDRTAERPTLYPNPALGETWIDLHAWEGRACTIRLMDVHSGLLREIKVDEAGHEPIRLDVSGLASGMYFVQVQTRGEAQMLKMVVARN